MAEFQVVWQNTESNDRQEQKLTIRNAATAEHAVWEAARQLFGPQHPDLVEAQAQDLVRVDQLSDP